MSLINGRREKDEIFINRRRRKKVFNLEFPKSLVRGIEIESDRSHIQ